MGRKAENVARFDIKRCMKAHILHGLSSTVIVDGKEFVNVRFSGALAKRAGMLLPRGISSDDPAFMILRFNIKNNEYTLYVRYLRDHGGQYYPLLKMTERPDWIRFAKPLPTKIQPEE